MVSQTKKSFKHRPPELTSVGEGPAFTVASAVADSYLTGKEDPKKILSEIPNFLEKHGVITDVDTLSKLFNEDKSRALAHDGQEFKKWAYNPSWRPGTAKKLTNEEAFSRLATQAQLSSKFRRENPTLSFSA